MGRALCCNITEVDIFSQCEPREGVREGGGEGGRKIGQECLLSCDCCQDLHFGLNIFADAQID